MTLIIAEVIGRSEQGRTQPYICRAEDGKVYFVKGRSASRYELITEWLCANLAQSLGLPIAPFSIATVPHEILEADATGWLRVPCLPVNKLRALSCRIRKRQKLGCQSKKMS